MSKKGIKPEDTEKRDLKLFDRENTEVLEYDQWNTGINERTNQVALGFRRRLFGVAFKTTIVLLGADDAIKIGEQLVSQGVAIKSKDLSNQITTQ